MFYVDSIFDKELINYKSSTDKTSKPQPAKMLIEFYVIFFNNPTHFSSLIAK